MAPVPEIVPLRLACNCVKANNNYYLADIVSARSGIGVW